MFEKRALLVPGKSHRRPILGVGINDADYCVKYRENGTVLSCPIYSVWKDMLYRCYSVSFKNKFKTYANCELAKEWLVFSNFKKWMLQQPWENRDLDKDLLVPGNKIYTPNKCLFIPHEINLVVVRRCFNRGKWPQGVSYNRKDNVYQAKISISGKHIYLGGFKNSADAEQAYLKAKKQHIWQLAQPYKLTEPKLYVALMQYTQPEMYN